MTDKPKISPLAKYWSQYTKEERREIMLQRRKAQGLPEGKKVYKKTYKRRKLKYLTEEAVAAQLSETTGCCRAEARFWFQAVSALIQHELAHEQSFKIPGAVTISTSLVEGQRNFNIQTQSYITSKTWIKVWCKLDKELKARYRENHPYETEVFNEPEISIEDLC